MSYRTFENRQGPDEADVIIVGAGPAGLALASTLGAKGGKKVMVLEQHEEVPGGCMHTFKLGKHVVCSGVHYIGRLSQDNQAIFDFLTGQKYTFSDPDEVFDVMFGAKDGGEITGGNFADKLGLKKGSLERLVAYFRMVILIKMLWTPLAAIAYFVFWVMGWKDEGGMNWEDWCRKHSVRGDKSNYAWHVQQGDHGVPRDKTCAMIGGGVAKHYLKGSTHMVGGYQETVRLLCKKAKDRGVRILIQAKVDSLTFDQSSGLVSGVMCNGINVKAPEVVICGAWAYSQILKEKTPESIKYALTCGRSPQHGCVFLGYNGKTRADIGIKTGGNMWLYSDFEDLTDEMRKDLTGLSGLFMSSHESEAGTLCIVIFECPYINRDGEYLDKKEQMADTAKNFIFKYYPKMKNPDEEDASTPATTAHYIASDMGCSYGLAHDTRRFTEWKMIRALKPESDIPNVWLTGQDVISAGAAVAFANGVLTAQVMLRRGALDFFRNNIITELVDEWKKKPASERGLINPPSSKKDGAASKKTE